MGDKASCIRALNKGRSNADGMGYMGNTEVMYDNRLLFRCNQIKQMSFVYLISNPTPVF